MKFATLGVTLRPSLPISIVSQSSHLVLCSRERCWCAVSSIAAMPAAMAEALTLNGPRMRLIASITCAGPYIQPSRTAARPWIFENVRHITTFSLVATISMPDS